MIAIARIEHRPRFAPPLARPDAATESLASWAAEVRRKQARTIREIQTAAQRRAEQARREADNPTGPEAVPDPSTLRPDGGSIYLGARHKRVPRTLSDLLKPPNQRTLTQYRCVRCARTKAYFNDEGRWIAELPATLASSWKPMRLGEYPTELEAANAVLAFFKAHSLEV